MVWKIWEFGIINIEKWFLVAVAFIESWDNLWTYNLNFSRKGSECQEVWFYKNHIFDIKQPLSALCCSRYFSLGHHSALKTLTPPDFMASVGSQIIHGRKSQKNWSHCSRLWFGCWRKTEQIIYHLKAQVREKRNALCHFSHFIFILF